MQIVRLVFVGVPDRYIAFNSLPEKYFAGVEKASTASMPKEWREDSKEHYVFFPDDINKDKDRWSEIDGFVRRVVDPSFRLKDKLAEMAIPAAKDCQAGFELEIEQVPVIPIPLQHQEKLSLPKIAKVKAEEPTTEKAEHSCKSKGKGGRYAPEGECQRCDQIRAEKLVTA
jgi:hypothetical protein